jgi:hypothetical protein
VIKEARYNLQKGKAENRSIKAYNYNIENELDAYILAKVKNRKLILDAENFKKVMDAAQKDMAAAIVKEVNKALGSH